ncbi:MAG: EAL domain-containing protein [Legionellales bacterium]|nr:EAL domain-containing protein [Legionellales bacterium]
MVEDVNNEPIFYASENPNPVFRFDFEGQLVYANQAAQVITAQWLESESQVTVPDEMVVMLSKAVTQNAICSAELTVDERVYHLDFVPFTERHYVNVYGFDISPRKQLQQQVTRLQNYDVLTNLPNRKQLVDFLNERLSQPDTEQGLFALFAIGSKDLLDLRHTLDHQIYEALLSNFAERVQACLPSHYFIARTSETQFIVVSRLISEDADATNIAELLIEQLTQPLFIEGHDLAFRVHIGIAIYAEDTKQAERLVRYAEMALSAANHEQISSYHFYHQELDQQMADRHRLVQDLRQALKQQQFIMYYQSQHSNNEAVLGFEALIHWQHGQHGLLMPGRFLDIAEEYGLMQAIGQWRLNQVCHQVHQWQKQGYQLPRIAINISPSQFKHAEFVQSVAQALKKNKVSPALIELEIAEKILLADLEQAQTILTQLAELGVRLVVDDFGTSYKSFHYLAKLPVHKLKIDRTFVSALDHATEKGNLIDHIIHLGHQLGLDVIAEGVENVAEANYLIEQGCDELQGYYYSEPLPADEIVSKYQF